jgi:hypothetical protein
MPSSNPMTPQGTINRLRSSVTYAGNGPAGDVSSLNVTASYLDEAGIAIALEGVATEFHPTMVGVVTSPNPYMLATVTINILKTQNIAALYKAQMELNTLIGDFTLTPDAATLPTYTILNGGIETVKEMNFNGKEPGWAITIKGYYLTNNALWNI